MESWEGVKTNYSSWQLKQKRELVKKNSKQSPVAELDLDRIGSQPSLLSLQFGLLILLYLALYSSLSQSLKPVEVWLAILVSLLLSNLLAKSELFKSQIARLYQRAEPKLIKGLRIFKSLTKFTNFSSLAHQSGTGLERVESVGELLFLVENSSLVVDDSQKKMIKAGLKFADKTVEEVMVPFGQVMTIEADDVLGPLRLDELHKTGEEYFPVMSPDNKVLGIVYLAELVTLGDKDTKTAKEAMNSSLIEVQLTEPLENLLEILITERSFLAIVNKNGQPLGLVSLKSIIGELTGRQVW